MSPALLVASFVLGLIVPAILKPDLPKDLPPIAIVIDNMARLSAFVLALGLLGFIASVEIGDDKWTVQYLSIAALLALWTLALLGGSFLMLGWHRLQTALGGPMRTAAPMPSIAAGTHFVTMIAALVIGMSLNAFALTYSDLTSESVPSWVVVGSAVSWACILLATWFTHRVQVWQEGYLPTSWQLARALADQPGAWNRVSVVAIADETKYSTTAAIWVQGGRWFWRSQDVRQLVRYRSAAATRARYPSPELHTRNVTFCAALGPKSQRPWSRFGLHVSERTSIWPRPTRYERSFDRSDFGDLPQDAWGLLVPVEASTLRSIGLIAKLEEEDQGHSADPRVLRAA